MPVTPASSRFPAGRASRIGARRVATCLAAALATLAIGATFRYAGGASPQAGAGPRAEGMGLQERRAPRIQLADTGESWPRSFFEGLFGIPQQSAPRRPAVQRPLPRREYRQQPRQRRSRETASPARATPPQKNGRADHSATYRTMCVRLCDGYYWPISFATHQDNFGRDSRTCARSCSAPAALYYYPNPGGEPEEMISLDGLPYADLRTAFLYRATYDADCKCRPHPWETEAMERHRGYAHSKQSRAAARSRR